MRADMLYDAITQVRDELVDEAAQAMPEKKPVPWRKFAAAAAAVLLVGAGSWAAAHLDLRLGSAPGDNASGGSGHDNGSTTFMSYAGPVFPLTTLEGGGGLTASRELTYDFSPWLPVWRSHEKLMDELELTGEAREEALKDHYEWKPEGGYYEHSYSLLVTDSYTLANPTEEDRTVTLLYPFASSLWDLRDDTPALTLDGAEIEPVLRSGGYSGGFQTAGGESTALLNLKPLNSWEQYRDLLEDGSYLETALGAWPDLSGVPVTVYRFSDCWGPEPNSAAGIPNPTIRAEFDLDYGKTTVLSYGFNGYSFDPEHGHMTQEFSIFHNDGESYYLIVLGDDIAGLTTQGYATGGADTTDTVEAGVTVDRYTTDLDSALRTAAEQMYQNWSRQTGKPDAPDFELYFGLLKDDLLSYGPLSNDPVARYSCGFLQETHTDTAAMNRVFYLEASVTVPAGGSVTVEARFAKQPSFDFYCAHTENQGVCGYDMVTKLDTNLDITVQTAAAVNTEYVEIVRQNYGFDWENGVNTAVLDQSVEHYYLEVRRVEEAAEP